MLCIVLNDHAQTRAFVSWLCMADCTGRHLHHTLCWALCGAGPPCLPSWAFAAGQACTGDWHDDWLSACCVERWLLCGAGWP